MNARRIAFLLVALGAGFGAGVAVDRAVIGAHRPDEGGAGGGEPRFAVHDPAPAQAADAPVKPGRDRDAEREEPPDPAELARLVDELDPERDRERRREAFLEWASAEPAAALTRALREDGDREVKVDVVRRAFAELARNDFAAAASKLTTLTRPDLRRAAVDGMAESVGRDDPAAFAGFLAGLPDAREYGGFLDDWARLDPGAAAGFVENLAEPALRSRWMRGVASGWSASDPEGAFAWANRLPATSDQWAALGGVMDRLLESDPLRAASLIDQLPPGEIQRHAAERTARQLAMLDLDAALEFVASQPAGRRAGAIEGLIEAWSMSNPSAAAAFAADLPGGEQRIDALRHVFERWAQSDPAAAHDWASSLSDPAARQAGVRGIIEALVETDPAGAAEFALASMHGSMHGEGGDLVEDIARRWAERDLDGAAGWMVSLEGAARLRAASGVLDQMAHFNAPGAAAMLDALRGGGASPSGAEHEFYADFAGELGARWAEVAPGEAARWAVGQADDSMRRRAVEGVADRWVRSEPYEASKWIAELSPGPVRDGAAGRLIEHTLYDDPASAFQWALSISEPGHQADLLEDVMASWQRTDPASARAALDAAPITEEARADIRSDVGAK